MCTTGGRSQRGGGRPAAIALVTASVLALGSGLAVPPAEAATAPSTVLVLGVGEFIPGGTASALGIVTSPNRRCLGRRRIKVSLVKPGGPVRLDVARSGKNGGWYARGPKGAFEGVTAVKVKLLKRKLGSGAGALRCRGDELELS